MAVFDANHDGVIDDHDAIWPKLRLWIDRNHDGVSQPEELYALDDLGVHSLSLKYTESRKQDQYGNLFRYKAPVNVNDPSKDSVRRLAYDVFLVEAR